MTLEAGKRLSAWNVLDDCRTAFELLRRSEPEGPEWRVHWVACLALLRAVGHVLIKVDAKGSPEIEAAANDLWEEWRNNREQNSIFSDFVDTERNRLLKNGQYGATPEPTYIVTETGEKIVTQDGTPIVTGQSYYRMSLKGFEDKDGLDLISAAIDWWHQQLTRIDTAIRSAP